MYALYFLIINCLIVVGMCELRIEKHSRMLRDVMYLEMNEMPITHLHVCT